MICINMAKKLQYTYSALASEIKGGTFAPIYLFYGMESYYIDTLSDMIVDLALTKDEQGFNLSVFYGLDADMRMVINACKRFPVMAQRQVVVVKEAQLIKEKDFELLQHYITHPLKSTILVVCYKSEKIKGAELAKVAKASSDVIYFESKPLSDRDVAKVIQEYVSGLGLKIADKSVSMLGDFIGTEVARIYSELDKLSIILPKDSEITPEVIERNIGISKDFNNYELQSAFEVRDVKKALSIINFFEKNPKNNPTILTTAILFSFFSSLLLVLTSKDRSEEKLMQAINTTSPFRLKKFIQASRYYTPAACFMAIGYLRDFDRKSKGIGSRRNEYQLLKELVLKIMYTR